MTMTSITNITNITSITNIMALSPAVLYGFLTEALFYFFAVLAILSALFMILAKNPVRAVLSLIVTFFSMGALWVLLQAEFLAMTLVLVYVGAVMVLFMFVIMMLDIESATLKSGFARYLALGLLVSVLVVGGLIYAVVPTDQGLTAFAHQNLNSFQQASTSNPLPTYSVTDLGTLLYTQYLYPFEIAGILLLVAIIAAISLSFRGRQHRKAQDPVAQILANKADRLRLVKMASARAKDTL